MRDYQRIKNNIYRLPPTLYRRMLWLVRDYDRLRDEYDNILHESPSPDGQPRGNNISDTTANKAVRRERLWAQIEAVDQALIAVPEEYRRGVFRHIRHGERFPHTANIKTWFEWQSRFLYYLAKRIGEF